MVYLVLLIPLRIMSIKCKVPLPMVQEVQPSVWSRLAKGQLQTLWFSKVLKIRLVQIVPAAGATLDGVRSLLEVASLVNSTVLQLEVQVLHLGSVRPHPRQATLHQDPDRLRLVIGRRVMEPPVRHQQALLRPHAMAFLIQLERQLQALHLKVQQPRRLPYQPQPNCQMVVLLRTSITRLDGLF